MRGKRMKEKGMKEKGRKRGKKGKKRKTRNEEAGKNGRKSVLWSAVRIAQAFTSSSI